LILFDKVLDAGPLDGLSVAASEYLQHLFQAGDLSGLGPFWPA